MPLTNEDNLRLNVLLRQNLYALRIDESKMIVDALTERGEGQVVLNPNCKDEKYVGIVKELISTHVLGSPIGYPVFIHRWARMGQSRKKESLQNLLKLGEPEAVVAVAHSEGLPVEIARYAWWALPTKENARTLLRHQSVVNEALGQELAVFLLEFLPFEAEPKRIVETVSLLLQPGILSTAEREMLWNKAATKSAYYPGFLITSADDLPITEKEHTCYVDLSRQLAQVISDGNTAAEYYLWLYSGKGRAFMKTIRLALKRPSQQDVVVSLFNAIGFHFSALGLTRRFRTIEDLQSFNTGLCKDAGDKTCQQLSAEIKWMLSHVPDSKDNILAMLGLAQLSEVLLDSLFGGNDSLGSVMRKQIKPVSDAILEMINQLES